MGEKDKTTKTLESYNSVFADIVNGFLFDGKQIVHEDELIPAEKESQFKTGGKILSQERDVSKFWMNMNIRIALIGCENQSIPDRLMALRVIGYDGSDYKRQYNEIISGESKDGKCYPVVTLVIYFGKQDWNYGTDLYSCMDIPQELKPFVNNYKMNFYSLKDMTPDKIEKFRSDFKIIAEFFYSLNTGAKYHPSDQKFRHPQEVLDMIDVFADDSRFRDEYNKINEDKEEGISMCELYDRIMMEGEAKGMEKGMEKGVLKTLADLVKKGLITVVQAAEQADMTVSEFRSKAGLTV